MFQFAVLIIAALSHVACSNALLPQEIIVQPTIKNEILLVKHRGADVFILRSTLGNNRNGHILISGPFIEKEIGELLAVPAVVSQDYRIVKQEHAWLILRFFCGNVYCNVSVQERIKQEAGSLNQFRDWWYDTISQPRLLRIDKDKWINDILYKHFGLELE